ncbi:hypothetical protein CLV58_12535 [Spirosoma oryzae]|uniref:Uncharacterized protein n=1 Tax=Spirosoma oryzae TaxID=1469603 RepID=A0A2T0S8Y7_9BACT|nr:hypothetical protein [Spirosoma oryzae]PRY29773.1 hypothetical protein CLV58_12535 [Spirosoma oryzae]
MAVLAKHLLAALSKMTPERLNQPIAVNRDDMGISGVVTKIRKAKADLLYDGEDDPSILKTRSQLRDEGYDKEDIDRMSVEIPKGALYLEF